MSLKGERCPWHLTVGDATRTMTGAKKHSLPPDLDHLPSMVRETGEKRNRDTDITGISHGAEMVAARKSTPSSNRGLAGLEQMKQAQEPHCDCSGVECDTIRTHEMKPACTGIGRYRPLMPPWPRRTLQENATLPTGRGWICRRPRRAQVDPVHCQILFVVDIDGCGDGQHDCRLAAEEVGSRGAAIRWLPGRRPWISSRLALLLDEVPEAPVTRLRGRRRGCIKVRSQRKGTANAGTRAQADIEVCLDGQIRDAGRVSSPP